MLQNITYAFCSPIIFCNIIFNVSGNNEESRINDVYSSTNPYLAPLLRCERVTSIEHFQDTRLVELDIRNSNISFAPGDVCMVQPSNLDDRVERFVRLFSHFDVDKVFQLKPRELDIK